MTRVSLLGLLLVSGACYGQILQNITVGSPKALALGHAVTADPPGLDSIHFNPAGLVKLTGRGQQFKLLGAHMEITSRTGEQRNVPAVVEEWENLYGKPFPVDDQANLEDTASTPMLTIPFEGLTEVPAIIAPFGGGWFEAQTGMTFATTIYTPAAFGFMRDRENDPGSYQGYEVALTRLTYLAPSVALQVSDTLAIGMSIGLSWHGFATRTKFRSPEQTLVFLQGTTEQLNDIIANEEDRLSLLGAYDNIGDLTLEMEDTLSPSFNLGILWEPTSWLSFGLAYQSEAVADMEREFEMEYSEAFLGTTTDLKPLSPLLGALFDGAPFNAMPKESGKASFEMTMPQHIALGTSVRVFPDLKINLDVKWTDYTTWDEFVIKFDQNVDFLNLGSIINDVAGKAGFDVSDNADPNELRLARGYQAVTSWALGVEYQWNDNTVVRFGYEPRGSAVPDDRYDFLVPIGDATLYSFGIGHRIDADSRMDFGIAYLYSEFEAGIRWVEDDDGNLRAVGESKNANDTTPGQVVYNPYAFLPISGETTAYLVTFSYDKQF
ncbi:MAG: outer membrane protein transport protein [Ketobacteraceae bacterium]|nr:outer membrane protein transport protein [Ketobacteraceae bacterium]